MGVIVTGVDGLCYDYPEATQFYVENSGFLYVQNGVKVISIWNADKWNDVERYDEVSS